MIFRDINTPSPYCPKSECQSKDKWQSVFPELNVLLLKRQFSSLKSHSFIAKLFVSFSDGNINQSRGRHYQVHYLFNQLLSNFTEDSSNADLLKTWKTLYEVSVKTNLSNNRQPTSMTKPLSYVNFSNEKFLILLAGSASLLLLINCCICLILSRRGHGCRKREYNCLNHHKQLNLVNQSDKHHPHHGGSSPSSTNSNGTITIDSTQQLIVNTNSHEQDLHSSPLSSLLCATNSSINSTLPVDILHPVNITKKNGILKCSTMKKSNVFAPSTLPEAIV